MMASSRIKGITIDIGGTTTKLEDSLQEVNGTLKTTQSSLKDVNRLLKMDPGNTVLLQQKQEYLSKAIEDTSKKLEIERDYLEKMKSSNTTGEVTEDQKALEREIESTSQQLDSYKSQLDQTGVSTEELGTKSENTSDKMDEIASNTRLTALQGLADQMSNVAGKVEAIGQKSIDAFKEIDEGLDIITAKTGNTTGAFDDIAKSIYDNSVFSMDDIGTAVGEINTRFGMTGDQLKKLSEQFLQFSELNGTEVNGSIDQTQKVLSAFGMSADDAAGMLDMMNKVGQDTGISMDTLQSDLISNADTLQSMGFNAASSAELLGKLEKSGLNTSDVLKGMSKVQQNAFADGASFQDEFAKALSSTDEAVDIFGSKTASKLYNAFDRGTLSAKDFAGSAGDVNDALGSVSETFDATEDPIGEYTKAQHSLTDALSLLGSTIQETVGPMLQSFAEIVRALAEGFKSLPAPVKSAIVIVGMLMVAFGKVLPVITSVITAVSLSGVSFAALAGPIGIAVLAIAGIVAAGIALYKNWDTIKKKAGTIWGSIKDTCSSMSRQAAANISSAFNALGNLGSKAKRWGSDLVNGFVSGIKSMIHKVKSAAESVANAIKRRLHFSEPDEGPLVGYEKWAEDFVTGYANAMRRTLPEIGSAASDMAVSIKDQTGSIKNDNDNSGRLEALLDIIGQNLPKLGNAQIVMDTGQLVGAVSTKMTSAVTKRITRLQK